MRVRKSPELRACIRYSLRRGYAMAFTILIISLISYFFSADNLKFRDASLVDVSIFMVTVTLISFCVGFVGGYVYLVYNDARDERIVIRRQKIEEDLMESLAYEYAINMLNARGIEIKDYNVYQFNFTLEHLDFNSHKSHGWFVKIGLDNDRKFFLLTMLICAPFAFILAVIHGLLFPSHLEDLPLYMIFITYLWIGVLLCLGYLFHKTREHLRTKRWKSFFHSCIKQIHRRAEEILFHHGTMYKFNDHMNALYSDLWENDKYITK